MLRALEEELGLVPGGADLIVGTSAGSVIGAYLRSGWSTGDLWNLVLANEHMPPAPDSDADLEALPELFAAAFRTPLDVVRRGLGSAFVLSRAVLRAPMPALPGPLRRAFPGGMFEMTGGRRRFEEELPAAWPAEPTWLCAVDIVSGRRVVLGRRRAPRLPFPRAVMASCAIPGVYPPVRYGRRELIDGGSHSTTNLDLAGRFGCDVVLGVVPMGYDPADAPGCAGRLVRRIPGRSVETETRQAERRGSRVALVAPSAAEVRLHGISFMRSGNLVPVARAAYDSTCRQLADPAFRQILEPVVAGTRRAGTGRNGNGPTAGPRSVPAPGA